MIDSSTETNERSNEDVIDKQGSELYELISNGLEKGLQTVNFLEIPIVDESGFLGEGSFMQALNGSELVYGSRLTISMKKNRHGRVAWKGVVFAYKGEGSRSDEWGVVDQERFQKLSEIYSDNGLGVVERIDIGEIPAINIRTPDGIEIGLGCHIGEKTNRSVVMEVVGGQEGKYSEFDEGIEFDDDFPKQLSIFLKIANQHISLLRKDSNSTIQLNKSYLEKMSKDPLFKRVDRKESIPSQKINVEQELREVYEKTTNFNELYPVSERLEDRGGVAAVLASNEKFDPEELMLGDPDLAKLDGHLVMVGCGSGLSMTRLWPEDRFPESIVGVDIDPIPIIVGKTLVYLAKNGYSREEVDSLFFGTVHMLKDGGYVSKNIDDLEIVAKKAIKEEKGPLGEYLRKIIDSGKMRPDLEFIRLRHDMHYELPEREQKDGPTQIKDRINTPAVIWNSWEKICEMANEGRIAFCLGSIKNKTLLKTIKNSLPDWENRTNLFYVSNVTDHLRRAGLYEDAHVRELGEVFERRSAEVEDIYVFTRTDDSYRLQSSHSAPDDSQNIRWKI